MKLRAILTILALLVLVTSLASCLDKSNDVGGLEDGSYDEEIQVSTRPDYLPEEMFNRLPTFPEDFYQVRELILSGEIIDLGSLSDEYWLQPEFFPQFEETGLPLLQNPPKDRWGAYGVIVYPGDSISTIVPGESIDLYFFIKSGYLVETYQGISLEAVYPESVNVEPGLELPDGSKQIDQNSSEVKELFDVKISPDIFVLESNYPVYNLGGTQRIRVTVQVLEETPEGIYVVGIDTGTVPEEYEQEWLAEYAGLYASGSMTKFDRPYYQAFINVIEE